MEKDIIQIKGARVNNLKNLSVDIPRNQFVVISGVSGSGKSSLAFDTLYAEGQRRYVESLSAYARQFLGRMSKPECDYIKGLPPAIAIEQKVIARNPRSTVGTSTEIYEFLRLLFARIGKIYSPISGSEVKKHTADDVVAAMLAHAEGEKFMLLSPLVVTEGRTVEEQLEAERMQGFERTLEVDGKLYLVVDRLKVSDKKETVSRLTDSTETAFYEGQGECALYFPDSNTLESFSTRLECDGITFEELSDNLFSFNSPVGVCPTCEGFGKIMGIDESLVIPDPTLSVYDGCVQCWKGEKMGEWKRYFIRRAEIDNFPIFTPYKDLSKEHKGWLWHGLPCDAGADKYEVASIDNFFRMVRENQYKIQYRVMLSRYRGKTICPDCNGTRLRKEAGYVKIAGKNIQELVDMPIIDLHDWLTSLQLSEHDSKVAERLLKEINSRIQFLLDVGLGYLTLNRPSNTLSGGESQRINLTTSLGSSLVGSLYILDEPSIGMHSRDTERLIGVLRKLQQIGNTVVVVEHDEEILRAADYIIDIGPDAGTFGGKVVFEGTPEKIKSLAESKSSVTSHTISYLTGKDTIPVPSSRRPWNRVVSVKGASLNNLKNVDVDFPLNVMTVVTGVSGSGKSSLVRGVLFPMVSRNPKDYGVEYVEMVDQNPIGKSTRSNPATYIKAYDAIRQLYASQPLAKQLGITPAHFSFNAEGGRCEECKGAGVVTVEMQFMADLQLTCDACHGKRFQHNVLEVRYKEKNISDVLDMTVDEAIAFFDGEKAITDKLKPLADVGLGYIQLGQSSSTLSGGENQRVKLAYYIGMENQAPTMFIFDEPTTGLHFHDIKKLLHAFDELLKRGHTIVIIEHNMDVIKCADHIIDLGPEGGDRGGKIIASGVPEAIINISESITGKYLKAYL